MRELKKEQGEYIHIVSNHINLVKVGAKSGKEQEEVLLAKQNKRFIETMVNTSTHIQRKENNI